MNRESRIRPRLVRRVLACVTTLLVSVAMQTLTPGCAFPPLDGGNGGTNTDDPTNGGATYLQSAACAACHPAYAARHAVHGHSQILKKLAGGPPSYPADGARAGVPKPPEGTSWYDVRFVIGGYRHKALFLDDRGYVMTDGVDGVNTQWDLGFLPIGAAGWASYLPDQIDPKPYELDCLRCHTTGPDPTGSQDSLVGIEGTFVEPGVQCEACHGPGSNHVPNPPSNIYVNTGAAFCGECHSRSGDVDVIPAEDGYIRSEGQYQELLASPHADFSCLTCHDAHASVTYDRDNAIINECSACHTEQNMALHEGEVYVQGDYVERLTCESCHMPFATRSARAAGEAVVGPLGRMGDVRTHLWSINTDETDYTAMFSADGTHVAKDAQGKAAVTVDFVCIRCHNDIGNAFALTVKSASNVAPQIHETTP